MNIGPISTAWPFWQRGRALILGGIDQTRAQERLATLHASAAFATVHLAALVTGPCAREIHAELGAFRRNTGLVERDEGPEQFHAGVRAEFHRLTHRLHKV